MSQPWNHLVLSKDDIAGLTIRITAHLTAPNGNAYCHKS